MKTETETEEEGCAQCNDYGCSGCKPLSLKQSIGGFFLTVMALAIEGCIVFALIY